MRKECGRLLEFSAVDPTSFQGLEGGAGAPHQGRGAHPHAGHPVRHRRRVGRPQESQRHRRPHARSRMSATSGPCSRFTTLPNVMCACIEPIGYLISRERKNYSLLPHDSVPHIYGGAAKRGGPRLREFCACPCLPILPAKFSQRGAHSCGDA